MTNSVSAAPIILFNSGVDGTGAPLPLGSSDPHFTVLETGNPAKVMNPHPFYLANSVTSQWIWENTNGFPINVTRTFRTTFDLTGLDPTTASITGAWAMDNIGLDIKINGNSTGIALPMPLLNNFQTLHAFSISSGFQAGVNTLDFVIKDVGVIAGFRVELSGTAQTISSNPVPEPSTMLLLSSGLFGMAAWRWKKMA